MQLVRFRDKGRRRLYEDGNASAVASAMADKLRKLLLALETAETLEQLGRFPGWRPEGTVEPDYQRKLAADFSLRRKTNTASDVDLIDYR